MLTTQDFIERARRFHHDKYDYSKTDYQGSERKVIITCRDHGDFEQRPADHWRGRGCRACSGVLPLDRNSFLEKARRVHGDKYEYSKVVYVSNKRKVTIICPQHGEFEQTPNNHMKGQGCLSCYDDSRALTFDEFLDKAREVHGSKYDYSKVNYVRCSEHVIIGCPIHGDFPQLPTYHLFRAAGCTKCNESKGEKRVREFLELNGFKYQSQWSFPDCKNKYILRFDFIVFTEGSPTLIEFNGFHHYGKANFGGRNDVHASTVKNDKIKAAYCKRHGYSLVVIPYYEYKNIDVALGKALGKNGGRMS